MGRFNLEIEREALGPFSPRPSKDAPMLHEKLNSLDDRPAKSDLPKGVMVEVGRFYPGADNAFEPKLRKDEQTGDYVLDAPFILRERGFSSIEAERIDARNVQSIEVHVELEGNLPDHLPLRYRPKLLQRPQTIEPGLDIPNSVFSPDTSYIYRDTSFPWNSV